MATGGDEAFAGYQRYYADQIADTYKMMPALVRHRVFDGIFQALPVQTDRPMERSPVMALRQLSQAADLSHSASVVRWGGTSVKPRSGGSTMTTCAR